MIVQCPECNTKFRVDAQQLGLAGRDVRCCKCQHIWHQAATEEDLLAESLNADIVFEEMDEDESLDFNIRDVVDDTAADGEGGDAQAQEEDAPPAEPEPADESWMHAGAEDGTGMDWRFVFVSFAVFFLLTSIVCLLFPMKTIHHFPQTYPIYKALNLVSSSVIVHPVDAQYRKDHYGDYILYVELELENISNDTVPVEPLEVGLQNAEGQVLKTWPMPLPGRELKALERAPLKFGLRGAPQGGKTVVLRKDLYTLYSIPHKAENHDAGEQDHIETKQGH